jgi:hypothetical protein
MDPLISAIEAHQWQVVVGIALAGLVALAGDVAVRAGLQGRALQIVSLARGYAGGVASSLLALAAAGSGQWWYALLAGLGGPVVSAGARDLLVDLVRHIARRGSAAAASLLLGGALLVLAGCGGAPIAPDPRPGDGVEPCAAERALVEGLDDAVGAVDDVLPDDAPKAAEGLSYARGGVEQGLAAVAACEALTAEGRSGLSAVLPWITVAGHVVRGLMAILMAAGVDLPDALVDVLHSLGLAQADAPPIDREAPYAPAYVDVAVTP